MARERRLADRTRRRRGDRGLHPHRLPAVARPAHRQRAHRGRRGAHPDPVRVLRARGPRASCCATINLVRDHLNPDLDIKGVVLTMYDARTNLSAEVADEVRRHLDATVYPDRHPAERAPLRGAEPTASRWRCTAPSRRAPRRIGSSPTSSSAANRRVTPGGGRPSSSALAGVPAAASGHRVVTARPGERPAALGRGLASLIPGRPGRDRGADRDPARPDRCEPIPAPPLDRRRRAARRSRPASPRTASSSPSS